MIARYLDYFIPETVLQNLKKSRISWVLEEPWIHREIHPHNKQRRIPKPQGLIQVIWENKLEERAISSGEQGEGTVVSNYIRKGEIWKVCIAISYWAVLSSEFNTSHQLLPRQLKKRKWKINLDAVNRWLTPSQINSQCAVRLRLETERMPVGLNSRIRWVGCAVGLCSFANARSTSACIWYLSTSRTQSSPLKRKRLLDAGDWSSS